jgi:hypothetical protein
LSQVSKLTENGLSEVNSAGVTTNDKQYTLDQRVAASFILYPKPFGVQAEYNRRPRYNKLTNTVDESSLEGGYVTLNYKWDLPKDQKIYPFAKFQYYDGGKKFEKDARSYVVRDYELGMEPIKAFELVATWVIADRTSLKIARYSITDKEEIY